MRLVEGRVETRHSVRARADCREVIAEDCSASQSREERTRSRHNHNQAMAPGAARATGDTPLRDAFTIEVHLSTHHVK